VAGRLENFYSIRDTKRTFFFQQRPDSSGIHSPAAEMPGVRLTTRVRAVPGLRMREAEPPLHHASSWFWCMTAFACPIMWDS
jgi:hypothetical protein